MLLLESFYFYFIFSFHFHFHFHFYLHLFLILFPTAYALYVPRLPSSTILILILRLYWLTSLPHPSLNQCLRRHDRSMANIHQSLPSLPFPSLPFPPPPSSSPSSRGSLSMHASTANEVASVRETKRNALATLQYDPTFFWPLPRTRV